MKKTNKKTNKKIKNKQKNKHNKTKTKRHNIKKGGHFIQEGTYGSVYSKPRLLCKGETFQTPGIYNEVAKIFENDYDAIYEYDNITNLTDFMTESGSKGLEELKQYAIIPKKICNVNRGSLMESPYSDDAWMINYKKNEYSRKIFNPTRRTLPPNKYNKIIISDEGGNDLYEIIENITSYDDFKNFLQKLTSVGKAIQLLQNKGLIHGDIKHRNCLEHDNTFKLIDLSDVRKIHSTNEAAAMPTAFCYIIWPITAFYTYLFEKGVVFNKMEDIKTIITYDKIKENFIVGNQDNNFNQAHIISSYRLFNNAFSNRITGCTQEQLEIIKNIKKSLIDQKIPFLKYDGKLDIGVLRSIILELNEMFISEFKDIAEFKLDLFRRIDIYSFGIIILQCIEKFLKSDDSIRLRNNEEFCKKMIELYGIVYQCCDQKERVADINEIIDVYTAVVNTM